MKGQKMWNYLTVVAFGLIILGYFIGRADAGIISKIFIIFGVLVFIASIIGSTCTSKKRPYKCPICGSVVKPVGRWLPGLGFNGTNAVVCSSCGATIHIQDLRQE